MSCLTYCGALLSVAVPLSPIFWSCWWCTFEFYSLGICKDTGGRKELSKRKKASGNWVHRLQKPPLDRPSVTGIKVKTLFGRNNGCSHSRGVCVSLHVCAPRIPPRKWNHWIIKAADAHHREQYHWQLSEGTLQRLVSWRCTDNFSQRQNTANSPFASLADIPDFLSASSEEDVDCHYSIMLFKKRLWLKN